MRRLFAGVLIGLTASVISLASMSRAGAAGDPAVTISANCGGQAFCFTPSTLTINDGDTVTWSNASGADHIVSRCDPGYCDGTGGGSGTDAAFTSGDVPMAATFSHTFHGTGAYNYFCPIHGYAVMHGVIVVNAAPPPPTATTVAPSTTAQSGSTASIPGSTPESAAATTAIAARGPQLAHTGSTTGGTFAVGIAALVLGLSAWGVCTPRRGVVSRLRK